MPTPTFEPSAEQRGQVKVMAGYGIKHDDIAYALKIDPKTLRKYFRTELDEGMALANVNIGRSLYEMAVGRPAQVDQAGVVVREELKPDKSAAIFLGKTRLGLRETSRVEHTGADGGPINTIDIDLSVLTDEELTLFMQLYEKARRRARDALEAEGAPAAE
jgi:hypothetical protein